MHLTRQLVLCKYGVLRGSNCCSSYRPANNLYIMRCCCMYCTDSIRRREKREKSLCCPAG
ncbi:MAG: hypothetical protein WCB90_12915 [Methanosarcina sp.]